MPKGFIHPNDVMKGKIEALHGEGISNREIARRLGCGEATIRRNLVKLRTQGNMDRNQTPRIRKTSAAEDRLICRTATRDPKLTAREIAIIALGDKATLVSDTLIIRRLKEKGIECYAIVDKPLLTARHRRARVAFARAHKHWTSEEWRNVLWSDESKFNLFAPDCGKRTVFRRKGDRLRPECTRRTLKYGGGHVTVWGSFSFTGVGLLHQIDGIMNQVVYRNILSKVMVPSAYKLFGQQDFIYQQDNDPKHTAKSVKRWLAKPVHSFVEKVGRRRVTRRLGKMELLEWPAQSPDLNPIENLWRILSQRRNDCKERATSGPVLMAILQEAWQSIPQGILMKLVESMPRRCRKIIRAKGWHIPY